MARPPLVVLGGGGMVVGARKELPEHADNTQLHNLGMKRFSWLPPGHGEARLVRIGEDEAAATTLH
jgi:hypothetical protein